MQNEVRASNPSYVTIPFVYFQMLAQAYYGRETWLVCSALSILLVA